MGGTRATIEIGGGGGSNIGSSDLTISSLVRKLTMSGALVGNQFNLRNSANTQNIFSFGGEGTMAIGLNANNSGGGSGNCVVIGKNATNTGQITSVAIGYNAQVTGQSGTAIGSGAIANWRSVAVGLTASSGSQYNVAIGEISSTTAFYNVAVGRYSHAYNYAVGVGANARAQGEESIAIGNNATTVLTTSKRSIAIGKQSSTTNQGSIALGWDTLSSGLGSIAMGSGIETTASYSITLGALAYAGSRTVADTHAFTVFLEDTDATIKFHRDNDSWFDSTGSFGFNTMTPDGSAVIDLTSTTKGFLLPRMTTVEKNAIGSPATALMVYDTTTSGLNIYDGAVWGAIGGGSNIATSDLTISAVGTRKLQMFGSASTDVFKLRDSADNFDMFAFDGDGGQAIGWKAVNSGTVSRHENTLVGCLAKNNGFRYATLIGQQTESSANGGTAVGYQAKVGAYSTAVGYIANANAGQYNISIGEGSQNYGFFGVAIGRYAKSNSNSVHINCGSATATYAVGIGYGADTIGNYTNCIGSYASANGMGSIAFGNGSEAINGIAIGQNIKVNGGLYSTAIGQVPYASVRTNTLSNCFQWYSQDTDPIIQVQKNGDSWMNPIGSLGINTITPDASSIIDLTSTTKGFLPPRMTTTERDAIGSPAEGLVIYNTTTNVLNFHNGTVWGAV